MNAQEQILGLLGTYRHRIYNVCYQVLRHEQDAEDTAQEVLLDLLDVMGRIRDEEHLRRWAHRAAFHRALNAKRGRKRRAEHERARGSAVEAGGLPEETADAIHGAVSRLDDSLRELVVEHYYEKATLEDLAERKGCSSVAIWKRLQKATERLKQELGRVGLGGMVAHVEPYLKSLTPARSPASVLAKHVIAKVAAVAAAGGLVATKSVLTIGMVVLGLLLFGAGVGGGFVIGARSAARREPEERVVATSKRIEKVQADVAQGPPAASADARPTIEGISDAGAILRDALREKLLAFCRRIEEIIAEGQAIHDKHGSESPELREFAERMKNLVFGDHSELRALILAEPRAYLAFLKEPQAGICLNALVELIFVEPDSRSSEKFTDFPRVLMDGLLEIVRSGTPQQRVAAIGALANIGHQPRTVCDAYTELLSDPDLSVQAYALQALQQVEDGVSGEYFARIRSFLETSPCLFTDGVDVLAGITSPEAEEYLLSLLVSTRDPERTRVVASAVQTKLLMTKPATGDRYAVALIAALNNAPDQRTFYDLIGASLSLPAGDAMSVMEAAVGRAPSTPLAEAVSGLLARMRQGEARGEVLREILERASPSED